VFGFRTSYGERAADIAAVRLSSATSPIRRCGFGLGFVEESKRRRAIVDIMSATLAGFGRNVVNVDELAAIVIVFVAAASGCRNDPLRDG